MGVAPGGRPAPNGLDFWWDSFPGNTANCWYSNAGAAPITSSPPPPLLPDCDNGRDPSSSVGTGNPANEGELVECFVAFETGNFDLPLCPWFETPPKPGSSAALQARSENLRARQRRAFLDFCEESGPEQTCAPFEPLLRAR
jgi:hypothetical protein